MYNEKLVELLNDLIEINNDRVIGYEKAMGEITDLDMDLKAVFARMAEQSRENKLALSGKIRILGGTESTDTTNLGKVYRAWMDIKSTFTNDERQTVLNSCEFGEDAAQKAYETALRSDAEIDPASRQMIMDQKLSLKSSHDLIKKYRDAHELVAK